MADVFISYASTDRALAQSLASDLERHGYTVWWDASLLSGDHFRAVITRELAAAQCIVVIWTSNSVRSDWVLAEAEHGRLASKLVPVRAESLMASAIPMPFGVLHTALAHHRDEITGAVQRLLTSAGTSASAAGTELPRHGGERSDVWPDGTGKSPSGERILAGSEFRDLPETPLLVVVPAGGFVMGSAVKEAGRAASEGPQHRIRIAAPLAVGKHPVTFREWDLFCDKTQSAYRPDDNGWGRGERPVVNVSWEDSQAYCEWLSIATGHIYRLLSEAEWEFCCRSGSTTRYAFGDVITTEQANFNGSVHLMPGSTNTYRKRTTPVGQFPPNAFGLSDMHGNVSEWVSDPWHDDYVGAPTDGVAWGGASGSRRIVRGGSWHDFPQHVRSAHRAWSPSSERIKNVGLRVCRSLG